MVCRLSSQAVFSRLHQYPKESLLLPGPLLAFALHHLGYEYHQSTGSTLSKEDTNYLHSANGYGRCSNTVLSSEASHYNWDMWKYSGSVNILPSFFKLEMTTVLQSRWDGSSNEATQGIHEVSLANFLRTKISLTGIIDRVCDGLPRYFDWLKVSSHKWQLCRAWLGFGKTSFDCKQSGIASISERG